MFPPILSPLGSLPFFVVSESRDTMRLSVRRAAILLIRPFLKELLTIVRADAKAQPTYGRKKKGVEVESGHCIVAIDRGPENSIHPPKDNLRFHESPYSLRDFIGKESRRIL